MQHSNRCARPPRARRRAAAVLLSSLLPALAACGGDDSASAGSDIDASHVHGLGFAPGEPDRVLVATHDGLAAYADGSGLQRVSELSSDLMGFAVGPAGTLYASGHPGEGEDGPFALGLIASRDDGQTWEPVGLSGVADFHALDAHEGGIYGYDAANGVLRTSRDGEEWRDISTDVAFVDIAADPSSERFVGTTDGGDLVTSADGGASFEPVDGAPPLVLVDYSSEGNLVGIDTQGRLQGRDDSGGWEQRGGTVDEGLQAFAVAPDGDLWVVDGRGLVHSSDGGSTFEPATDW